jgi:hypothetical protein
MTLDQFAAIQSRRRFLQQCGAGISTAALANLLSVAGYSASSSRLPEINPMAPRRPHFAPKAKNVILMYQSGAPSQLDLFDPKPGLSKWNGQSLPPSLTENLKLAFIKPNAKIMASPYKFKKYGQSGMEFSELVPHLGTCADDICMIRTMNTEAFNHDPGVLMLTTGHTQFGRPSIGSWVAYGLGSESQNLPGFVVLGSGKGPNGGSNIWGNGFLPSAYQGTRFRTTGDPILYLANNEGVSRELQRSRLDVIRKLNEKHYEETGDLEIAARINSYELAFRMQIAAPDLLDFSDEPQHILDAYGAEKEPTRAFGTNCLLARRMVERGVRFVMLNHGDWDAHQKIDKNHRENCGMVDQPAAALIKDLKQRGLLDSTLVIWSAEFGRTPMIQLDRPDAGAGRDHHPDCYSLWLAGGGIKPGTILGETDDIGLKTVRDKVHVHDLQATVLHCLGFDHEKLTYHHQGRDFRLTDVGGAVVNSMLS